MKESILPSVKARTATWCRIRIDDKRERRKKGIILCERCKGSEPYHPEIMVHLPGAQYAAIINGFLDRHADCKEDM